MKLRFVLILTLLLAPIPILPPLHVVTVHAQVPSVCTKTQAFAGTGGTAVTVLNSTSGLSNQLDICGFAISSDTLTRVNIKGGTVNLTDPVGLVVAAGGNVSFPSTVVTWSVPVGSALTVTCGTGTCAGFFTFRQ
jgi:hypothetical protein